jgi:hypothetical protein
MRGMKEGIAQIMVGRNVILMNKVTSFGWDGLVIVFSIVKAGQSQPSLRTEYKHQNGKYGGCRESREGFCSTPRIWLLCCAVRRKLQALTTQFGLLLCHMENMWHKIKVQA